MITGLTGQYRWIPVTEAMPSAYETVMLAYISVEAEQYGDPTDTERDFRDVDTGFWTGGEWQGHTEGVLPVENVTHWMALPYPPATAQMERVKEEIKEGMNVG